jgi:hypothetical protein
MSLYKKLVIEELTSIKENTLEIIQRHLDAIKALRQEISKIDIELEEEEPQFQKVYGENMIDLEDQKQIIQDMQTKNIPFKYMALSILFQYPYQLNLLYQGCQRNLPEWFTTKYNVVWTENYQMRKS